MLFIGVVIANIIIGIVQEIRSKISVDKLTILSEKKSMFSETVKLQK